MFHRIGKVHATSLQLTHYVQLLLQTKKTQFLEDKLGKKAQNGFKLLDSCVAKLNGKDMRAIESVIQNNPSNMNAQKELRDRTDEMARLYAEEIQKRLREPGLTKLVAKLCQEGNDSFRKAYDSVWDETIANSEQTAIEKYVQLMDKMKKVVRKPSIYKQPTSSLVELYVQAAVTKRKFDDLVLEIKKEFEALTSKTLSIDVCPTLKKSSRMVEKAQLKAEKAGDMSGVKDIVRAMITAKTMEDVNVVIQILFRLHGLRALEIVRCKDRFLKAPSGGGWRDIMVNVCVINMDDIKHICEIQVVHHLMLNARKEMAGHAVYNAVRNGLELLNMARGSVDVTSIADFDKGLDMPQFANWYSDKPVKEWHGIISCSSKEEILELDFPVLDPDLQVRHRLPNLCKMHFPSATIPKLHQKYVEQVAFKLYRFHMTSYKNARVSLIAFEGLQMAQTRN